jgi:phosphonate transport system permease protein
MNDVSKTVERLNRERPRDWAARLSLIALLALGLGSWIAGDFGALAMLSEQRVANLRNFLAELRPYPLQNAPFDMRTFLQWLGSLLDQKGFEAAITTLAIAVAAISLAGCAGAALSILAARTFATPLPFLPSLRVASRPMKLFWSLVASASRLFMIFVRAIPEYVWAFLFLALLGPMAWPLVLALAIHNMGILGRLGAEVVENTESAPPTALRALGATRAQIIMTAIFPLAFSRYLLFFLYRWETCVREASVLGMLGISSLGFWIQDARARNHYDEMFFFICLGGMLVVIGDIVSAAAREWVRRHA